MDLGLYYYIEVEASCDGWNDHVIRFYYITIQLNLNLIEYAHIVLLLTWEYESFLNWHTKLHVTVWKYIYYSYPQHLDENAPISDMPIHYPFVSMLSLFLLISVNLRKETSAIKRERMEEIPLIEREMAKYSLHLQPTTRKYSYTRVYYLFCWWTDEQYKILSVNCTHHILRMHAVMRPRHTNEMLISAPAGGHCVSIWNGNVRSEEPVCTLETHARILPRIHVHNNNTATIIIIFSYHICDAIVLLNDEFRKAISICEYASMFRTSSA